MENKIFERLSSSNILGCFEPYDSKEVIENHLNDLVEFARIILNI